MRLLMFTQKVDQDDDVLGVYHEWVKALAARVERLNVICLYKGRCELPQNVRVFSLGKEKLEIRNWKLEIRIWLLRIIYVLRFYRYLWRLRHDYDTVFVHMNPIYLLLGTPFWKAWGKRLFLWYNHPMGNFLAKFGVYVSESVFYTSPFSFAAKFGKSKVMPVGVDVELFKKSDVLDNRVDNSILYLGRISPIKYIEHLIEAVKILDSRGVGFIATIVGSAASELDRKYLSKLKDIASGLVAEGKVKFEPSVRNIDAPIVYNNHDVFVNLTPTGSFDKTTIEAMACERLVLVSNKVFEQLLTQELRDLCLFRENDPADLARKFEKIFALSRRQKEELGRQFRAIVFSSHNINVLTDRLVSVFTKSHS